MIDLLLEEIGVLIKQKKAPKGFLRDAIKSLRAGRGPEAIDLFLREQDEILPHEKLRNIIADITLAVLDPSAVQEPVDNSLVVLRYTDASGKSVETSDFSVRSVERRVQGEIVSDIVFDVPDGTIDSDLSLLKE